MSTIIGVVAGSTIPDSLQLDFAIPLSFIAILAPMIKNKPEVIAALIASITTLIFYDMKLNLWLIIAAFGVILAGILADYLIKTPKQRRAL